MHVEAAAPRNVCNLRNTPHTKNGAAHHYACNTTYTPHAYSGAAHHNIGRFVEFYGNIYLWGKYIGINGRGRVYKD